MCKENCKELKTGDLIKVDRVKELRVFLFSVKDMVYYCTKSTYETGEIQSHVMLIYKHEVTKASKVLRVKKASEIVKWLETNSYFVSERGHWYCSNNLTFNVEMFQYCGLEPSSNWSWNPEWLEEHYEPTA